MLNTKQQIYINDEITLTKQAILFAKNYKHECHDTKIALQSKLNTLEDVKNNLEKLEK